MEDLNQAVEQAISNGSWHAALALALALPDICGKIDDPSTGSQARYVKWFDTYVGLKYKSSVERGGNIHVFLGGADCYALRCAYLHEGKADITQQRARQALDSFRFVVCPPGWSIHKNLVNSQLQLDVAEFCRDVIAGVRKWQKNNRNIPFADLLTIEVVDGNNGFNL